MTRAQFLALMTAAGVGFVGGAAIDFVGGANPSATFMHGLRIAAQTLPDGGTGPDDITVYRTLATPEVDGGIDLTDIGPADCQGGTAAVRLWARNNCPGPDGGIIRNIRVIEVRPVGADDDGGVGSIAVEVYGDGDPARCEIEKPTPIRTFLNSLVCVGVKRRSGANPL